MTDSNYILNSISDTQKNIDQIKKLTAENEFLIEKRKEDGILIEKLWSMNENKTIRRSCEEEVTISTKSIFNNLEPSSDLPNQTSNFGNIQKDLFNIEEEGKIIWIFDSILIKNV